GGLGGVASLQPGQLAGRPLRLRLGDERVDHLGRPRLTQRDHARQDPKPRSPRAYVVDAVDVADVRVLPLEGRQESDVALLLGRLVAVGGTASRRRPAAFDVVVPLRPLLRRERIEGTEHAQIGAGDHRGIIGKPRARLDPVWMAERGRLLHSRTLTWASSTSSAVNTRRSCSSTTLPPTSGQLSPSTRPPSGPPSAVRASIHSAPTRKPCAMSCGWHEG